MNLPASHSLGFQDPTSEAQEMGVAHEDRGYPRPPTSEELAEAFRGGRRLADMVLWTSVIGTLLLAALIGTWLSNQTPATFKSFDPQTGRMVLVHTESDLAKEAK